MGSRVRAGLSLLEILLAMSIFLIVAGGATYALHEALLLSRANQERGLALGAARSVLEEMKATAFDAIFSTYTAAPAFDVPRLDPVAGDPDGRVGRISFPGNGATLREDLADRELGMPRDLNGDGQRDALDHSLSYNVLPVRVRVEWRGARGDQAVEIVSILSNSVITP